MPYIDGNDMYFIINVITIGYENNADGRHSSDSLYLCINETILPPHSAAYMQLSNSGWGNNQGDLLRPSVLGSSIPRRLILRQRVVL